MPLLRHGRAPTPGPLAHGLGERYWDIFRRLCTETDIRGSRATDAWFAALAIEWGCEWITLDRDYARFAGLKWQLPVGPAGAVIPRPES